MRFHRNEHGIVLGRLMKLLLFAAVAAFVLLNSGAIVTNIFGLSNDADEIAIAVSTSMADDPSLTAPQAEQQAQEMAHEHGAHLLRLWVDDTNVLHVRLQRRAHVALIEGIKALRPYVVAKTTGTSGIS